MKKNNNITTADRSEMTKQALDLRIENGAEVDPREEVVMGEETLESIFAGVDSGRTAGYGKHRVHLAKLDRKNDVVRSVKIVKNGVITETKPYIRLRFIDDATGKMIVCSTEREKDSFINYTTRLYAGLVDSLRRNVNREYYGVAEPMTTPELLEFLEGHSINIWTRWDAQYEKVAVDFFDRAAWEAEKLLRSQMSASAIRGGDTRRPVENKATR